MAIYTNFFDNTDYYAGDFTRTFKATNTDGLINTNDLLVRPKSPNNLSVVVETGECFINGFYVNMDLAHTLNITANTSGYNRKDLICMKLDINQQKSYLMVVQGVPSSSPSVPNVTAGNGEHYLKLAEVTVLNNTSAITTSDIYNLANFSNTNYKNGVSDFNSSTEQGVYSVGSDVATNIGNSPITSGSIYGTLFVKNRRGHSRSGDSSNYVNQTFISNSADVYTRVYTGSWSSWKSANTSIATNRIVSQTQDDDLYIGGVRNNKLWKFDRFNGNFMPPTSANIGSTSERVNTIYSTTALDVSSDSRLKENIRYVEANDEIMTLDLEEAITQTDMYSFVKDDLHIAEYNYINSENSTFGFIAQDVINTKVGAKYVHTGEDGLLSYDSGGYVNVLAGALKEAMDKISNLEAEVKALKGGI